MEFKKVLDLYKLYQSGAKIVGDMWSGFPSLKFKPGEYVFNQGAPSDAFYFIKSGRAEALKKLDDGCIHSELLDMGHFFGFVDLMEKNERSGAVKAVEDLEVFRFNRDDFLGFFLDNAEFYSIYDSASKHQLLHEISIFKDIDEKHLQSIQKMLIEKIFPKDAVVFEENDPPNALYIVLKGEIQLLKSVTGKKNVPVLSLGHGDFFGEMGLIEENAQSVKAVATADTVLLALSKENFYSVIKENPSISFNLLKTICHRVSQENKKFAFFMNMAAFFKGITVITRAEKCLSCKACEIACAVSKSKSHSLYKAIYEDPLPVRRIHIRKTSAGAEPDIQPEYCFHCRDAACLKSCKFGAIERDSASGAVLIIEEKCKGCGLCAKACPYKVVTMVTSKGKHKVALKCNNCTEHETGPACVRSCPTKALLISLPAALVQSSKK